MRECEERRSIGEEEEVGIMAATANSKKRKLSDGRRELSSNYAQPTRRTTRRRIDVTPENSVSPADSSSSSDHIIEETCCSSRNGSIQKFKNNSKFADLEEECVHLEDETSTYVCCTCTERRKTTPSSVEEYSEEMDSTPKPSSKEANSSLKSKAVKIVSHSELEEFFAEAEINIHKQFTQKYNYDIVKDIPLEGRYEWEPLKP